LHSYGFYEQLRPPAISWSQASDVLRTGVSAGSLFSLSSWWSFPRVPLMGTHHNKERIDRLLLTRAGGQVDGAPWHVGVLYEAPDDPNYEMRHLIGVVTRVGHVGCLMPGYFYIRPFIDALSQKGLHFVVPVILSEDDDDDVVVPFLRGRSLRLELERLRPPGVAWDWPPWPAQDELDEAEDALDDEEESEPFEVGEWYVYVGSCCAGVWAQFKGTNVEGQSVTVAGVVVAGPDEVTVNGRPKLAITVHDHRASRDHLLACDMNATADRINEVASYKLPHQYADHPVFGYRPVAVPPQWTRR
jgi:hypothetical protein